MSAIHPLQGAFDRVDRAEEHLTAFNAEQASFGQAYHDNLILEPNAQSPPDFSTREQIQVVPSAHAAILLGEFIYNLRAALDYLVYELAIRDSGKVQQDTQFPICSTVDGFNRVSSKCLVGLSSRHMAAIEQMQPYHGCNWAAVLRDISNPDKHRRLVRGDYAFRLHITSLPVPALRGINAPMIRSERRAVRPGGDEVTVYLATEAPIMISARTPGGNFKLMPVVMLAEQIKTGVRDTLEAFRDEF